MFLNIVNSFVRKKVYLLLGLSKPWFAVFTFGITNCDLFLKLYWSACLP